ncbi:MAG: DegT/DnrJ/EryC1/StrS family aminotransferase [Flavobacterium sp.]|nr:DegT/DnrJ/EryC1/StrS family aminotransferase [Pedobacter sp.]
MSKANKIQMADLRGQYDRVKPQIDFAIQEVVNSTEFINGPQVKTFESNLQLYLGSNYVIACGNGTDALQIALMALNLQPGDEVIVPCFTYVATAEVIALLRLTPVLIDVDANTFNNTAELIENAITSKTRAIVPVHLFGQCADMEEILEVARKHSLYIVEDTAQALGAEYTFSDGTVKKAGTMGDIGCTSFFPSKNLGCYGDGGALITNDAFLANRIRKIANHGQEIKYCHDVIGVNSRLDTLQAAILLVKLPHLDDYALARNKAADIYDTELGLLDWLQIPARQHNSTHVFHQYTLKLSATIDRELFKVYLSAHGVPSMIYYPIPLHMQNAFKTDTHQEGDFPISEELCKRVISLPIHTEMSADELRFITDTIKLFQHG